VTDYGTGWRETLGSILLRSLLFAAVVGLAVVAVAVGGYAAHVLLVAAERGWDAYGGGG
jgi:hypothetical protein